MNSFLEAMSPEQQASLKAKTEQCVACGFCLEACPTYHELGHEADSPRGRIALIDGLLHDELGWSVDLQRHLDRCLGCRACEPACPSGVPYGQILEQARAVQASLPEAHRPMLTRLFLGSLGFMVQHPRLLGVSVQLLSSLRSAGVFRAVEGLLPKSLRPFLELFPKSMPSAYRPRDRGPRGAPLAIVFAGCVQQSLFADVHRATELLLLRSGYRVKVLPQLGCCGALALHSGQAEQAQAMARRNIEALEPFLEDPRTRLVVNAAGCGAALKDAHHVFERGPWHERARAFSERVRDWSELVSVEALPKQSSGRVWRVASMDACHLAHAQGLGAEVRALFEAHPDFDLVPWEDDGLCCGSAGVYNVLQPDMAQRLQRRKVEAFAQSGAELLSAANPGCLLQLESGLKTGTIAKPVKHPAVLLAGLAFKENGSLS